MATLTINIKCRTAYGEQVRACGEAPAMGSWQIHLAPKLVWRGHWWWSVTLPNVPSQAPLEFKCLVVRDDGPNIVRWEEGANRVLQWPLQTVGKAITEGHVVVNSEFDQTFDMCVFRVKDPAESSKWKIMSFNIRFDNPNDKFKCNLISKIADVVRTTRPEIIGVEEALHAQANDLEQLFNEPERVPTALNSTAAPPSNDDSDDEKLPGPLAHYHYRRFGLGRDGGTAGELSPVYYNFKRFRVLTDGTFWLTPTPDTPSKDPDAACPRICSWGVFEDRLSAFPERLVLVANTHLDHVSVKARERGINVLLERLASFSKTHDTRSIVLLGDFNAHPNDPELAKITSNPIGFIRNIPSNLDVGTFTDWRPLDKGNSTIDYFFTSPAVKVHSHRIVTEWDKAAVLASDHRPLIATMSLNS